MDAQFLRDRRRALGRGAQALRWAVGGSGLLAAVGGLFFLAAGRHYPADLARPTRLVVAA